MDQTLWMAHIFFSSYALQKIFFAHDAEQQTCMHDVKSDL